MARKDGSVGDGQRDLDQRAVFIISVAAELAGVHPQTLRIYERKGLVRPKRTSGNTRRYSQADIDRLLAIQELTDEGVNLAGVKRSSPIDVRSPCPVGDRSTSCRSVPWSLRPGSSGRDPHRRSPGHAACLPRRRGDDPRHDLG
jgi:hypothetical protein